MTILEFTLVVWLGSLGAGFLGSLTGLGGGVVIVPFLTLGLGVDLRYAIGASLISVIATSSGAAAAYVREGYTNIRVGMFLEIATTMGAIAGGFLSGLLSTQVLAIIFGIVLLYTAYLSYRPSAERNDENEQPDPLANHLKLDSTYPTPEGWQFYHVRRVPAGFGLMFVAGTLSSLLGIGSGALKVLALDRIMQLPFKVSTTTSNFMIGVTAATGAGVYLNRGYIDPGLAMPVMLGVLLGSTLGARLLMWASPRLLRYLFSAIILMLALQMLYKGFTASI
ncbi:MAG: sulfite exporter TauE/SafE family protein [Microcystaceae cyanobacterium]